MTQRIASIILIISFLASGGLGAGAPVVLCTESDGTVHLENPFHRCCDDKESQEPESILKIPAAFSGRLSIIAFDQCGTCVDVLLVNSIQHDAAIPVVKADGDPRVDFLPPIALIAAPVADLHGLISLRFPSAASGGTAQASTNTVVLRC